MCNWCQEDTKQNQDLKVIELAWMEDHTLTTSQTESSSLIRVVQWSHVFSGLNNCTGRGGAGPILWTFIFGRNPGVSVLARVALLCTLSKSTFAWVSSFRAASMSCLVFRLSLLIACNLASWAEFMIENEWCRASQSNSKRQCEIFVMPSKSLSLFLSTGWVLELREAWFSFQYTLKSKISPLQCSSSSVK